MKNFIKATVIEIVVILLLPVVYMAELLYIIKIDKNEYIMSFLKGRIDDSWIDRGLVRSLEQSKNNRSGKILG